MQRPWGVHVLRQQRPLKTSAAAAEWEVERRTGSDLSQSEAAWLVPSAWEHQRFRARTGREWKGPQSACVQCLCAGARERAHRRAWVGAGFTVLPPGHVEAAHKLRVEGVRGVEHGEAQDVGGVLHDPVQVQDGEVLAPRRGVRPGAGPHWCKHQGRE